MPVIRALAPLLISVAVLGSCAEQSDPLEARARLREAIADSDPVRAREAAIDLGRELPDTPEAAIQVARLLADIGEMNQARWMLREARGRFPEHIDLSLGLAETSLRVGDAVGALAALEEIPEDAQQAAYAEVLRARAELQLGGLEEGLARLDRAHERFEEPVLFRFERIEVLLGEGRDEEALETVRTMQDDQEVPGAALDWLAVKEIDLVIRTEGPEAALPLVEALWALEPTSSDVATRRASLLVSLGRAKEALADLRTALEAYPEASGLYGVAAQTAVATGDIGAAEELLRSSLEIEGNAAALKHLALFLNTLGRSDEAAELLRELPEIPDPVERIELRYLAIALQIEAGELDEARARVEAFGRQHPNNPRLGYLLARLDLADGKPRSAAKRLGAVLTRLDRPDVKHQLALALERSGDVAGAELRYGHAIQGNPEQIPSWLGLLRTLQAQGKWERAEIAAVQLIRRAPRSVFGYQALAHAKLGRGRGEEAEQTLRGLLADYPKLPGPRVALSVALRRQGRASEALALLEGAGAGGADDLDLIAERGVVLGQLGRVDEAFALLEGIGDAETSTRSLRRAHIYLLFAAGRDEEALAEAERASHADPDDAEPQRMVADFLASRGRFEEAVAAYRRALERVSDAGLHFRHGVALDRSGREAEAIAAYRRAIEIDENSIGPRNNLALVLSRTGETQEALTMAQSAYVRAESDPVVMSTLARLYLESGLERRGVTLLEKAHRSHSDSVEIAYRLALAYRETRRPDDARSLLLDLENRLAPEHDLHEPVNAALASLR